MEFKQWLPKGAVATAVRIANKAYQFKQDDSTVEFNADLTEGQPTPVEIDFQPEIVIHDRAGVLNFPFVEAGRAACNIVHADNANEETRLAAESLAACFEYWTATQAKPGSTAATLAKVEGRAIIPVLPESLSDPSKPMVTVSTYERGLCMLPDDIKSAGVVNRRDNSPPVLEVAGRNGQAVNKAALALMRVLEAKYQYYGRIGGGHPIYERAGIIGSVFE